MKKMNNKGFSLVELIIVIAIMAVLVGVLAPQFLKYVESSRVQKDESAAGEVENAVKIACSVEDVYKSLPATGSATVSVKTGTATTSLSAKGITPAGFSTVTGATTTMEDELDAVISDAIDFSSKAHTATTADEYLITITVGSNGTVTVSGQWQ